MLPEACGYVSLPLGVWLGFGKLGETWTARCLPAPAFVPLPHSFLSQLPGGSEPGFLCFFFLSFSTRRNLLSVDCETVLETKSRGFLIATSISQVACLQLGLCPALALLARMEFNPDWCGLEAGMQEWGHGDMPPPRHDAVSARLAESVTGKGKHLARRRETYSKENQLVLLNYD